MNLREGESKPQAVILRFPRRRGRPKKPARPKSDCGTPELVMKRLLGQTAEALDLCLERGIIDREQHWCGIHLRWLYTLRHGAPGVRAIDPTHLGGIDIKRDDPDWREKREKEYHEAMKKLAKSGHAALVMSVCIHGERPKFLSLKKTVDFKKQQKLSQMITDLKDGLNVLVKHWGRK